MRSLDWHFPANGVLDMPTGTLYRHFYGWFHNGSLA
jgi:hypothetical protein